MPFFGGTIVSPTAWGRIKNIAVDIVAPFANVAAIKGAASAPLGSGQYEFDQNSLGQIKRASHSADITADITIAGPVAGGRDQGPAFTPSTFVYMYLILNSANQFTISAIFSAQPPTVGPTVPIGWQSPLFAGAYLLNATPQLFGGKRRNNWFYTAGSVNILNTATAPVTDQTVSYASAVPLTATEFDVITTGGNGSSLVQSTVGANTLSLGDTTSYTYQLAQFLDVAAQRIAWSFVVRIPVITAQIFHWIWTVTGVTSTPNTAFSVTAYSEPLT